MSVVVYGAAHVLKSRGSAKRDSRSRNRKGSHQTLAATSSKQQEAQTTNTANVTKGSCCIACFPDGQTPLLCEQSASALVCLLDA